MAHCWITYDIASPKRWRKVYNTLLDFGAWRQLSVFEINTTETEVARLIGALEEHVDPDEDQIIIQPVCASCAAGVQLIGRPLERDEHNVRII